VLEICHSEHTIEGLSHAGVGVAGGRLPAGVGPHETALHGARPGRRWGAARAAPVRQLRAGEEAQTAHGIQRWKSCES
jgi:hypothetical protein